VNLTFLFVLHHLIPTSTTSWRLSMSHVPALPRARCGWRRGHDGRYAAQRSMGQL